MSTLYTIGYAGWSPEQLRATVEELGAELWDIRYSPWSKSPQWQGHALRQLLGPAYVHMAALGNQHYKTGGEILLVAPDRAVAPARRVLERRPLVLLCGCKDWATCHRTVAALYLAEMIGVRIEHLTPPAKAPALVARGHVWDLLETGEPLPETL